MSGAGNDVLTLSVVEVIAGAAGKLKDRGADCSGKEFSLSVVSCGIVLDVSALSKVRVVAMLSEVVSAFLAGFMDGTGVSSSLCDNNFLTRSSFLLLSSSRSSFVTTKSVFLEYLEGLFIDGTLCFFPVMWTILRSFRF